MIVVLNWLVVVFEVVALICIMPALFKGAAREYGRIFGTSIDSDIWVNLCIMSLCLANIILLFI